MVTLSELLSINFISRCFWKNRLLSLISDTKGTIGCKKIILYREKKVLRQKKFINSALMAVLVVVFGAAGSAFGQNSKPPATFTVRIENISQSALMTTGDAKYPFAVSPGLYLVSKGGATLFKAGGKASAGLEAQAEDGNPAVLAKELTAKYSSDMTGIFNTPVGANGPAPLLPGFATGMMTTGGAFEFTITATKGMKLNLITMFGQSNDLFYSNQKPIDLFDKSGNAINGDITSAFSLWDAGTEVNQAPGIGEDQAPRQKAANTGKAENGKIGMVKDGFTYPNTADVLKVTVTRK